MQLSGSGRRMAWHAQVLREKKKKTVTYTGFLSAIKRKKVYKP